MRLDTPTLMVVTVLVTLIAGALFLLSWSQDRSSRALACWGVGHLAAGLAAGLLSARGLIPNVLSIALANAILMAAHGLFWIGVRAFEGRPTSLKTAFAGAIVWVAACGVPTFYQSLEARIVLAASIAALYTALAARELWQSRRDGLASRRPALALLVLHAAFCLARVPLAILYPLPTGANPLLSPWVAILSLEAVLYSVTLAFVFMALTKERAEQRQRLVAETDALTGIANRRALLGHAQKLLENRAAPVALVLFDLEHFKRVNDSYGHGIGDAVLLAFCFVAQSLLPPNALLGRLGGEEFACVVPGASSGTVREIADLIRRAVEITDVDGFPELRTTVSVGISSTVECRRDFDSLLREADAALYRAKRQGRNRIEGFDPAWNPGAALAA